MSQSITDAGFAGAGKFVGLLIVRLAQRHINESHKCCSVTFQSIQCLSH